MKKHVGQRNKITATPNAKQLTRLAYSSHRIQTSLLLDGLLRGLGDLCLTSLSLLHRLDDADRHGLSHVAHGKATKRSIVGESLDTHRLLWNHFHDGCVSGFDVRRIVLELRSGSSIDLFEEFAEPAGNMRSVTVDDGSVSSADLARVIEDDDLVNKERNVMITISVAFSARNI